MCFDEWLKSLYGKTWNDLFCKVSDKTLISYMTDYELYCSTNNIEPSWF